jgi:hypothetical protein
MEIDPVRALILQQANVPQTLEQAQNVNLALKQEVKHLQGVLNSAWNERAAMFRRNSPVPPPGTPTAEQFETELRVICNAFLIAKLVPWRDINDPNDPCVMFHLSVRRLIEVRLQTTLHFTKQDALDAGVSEELSYEHLYVLPNFNAPKPIF